MNTLLLKLDIDLLRFCCDSTIFGLSISCLCKADGSSRNMLTFVLIIGFCALAAIPIVRRMLHKKSLQLLANERLHIIVTASFIERHEACLRAIPGFFSVTNHRLLYRTRDRQLSVPLESVLKIDQRSRLLGFERWISVITPEEKLTFGVNFPATLATAINAIIEKSQ